MSHPIVNVDTSEIRHGELERVESAMTRLAAFVESNVPRLITYGFYLDGTRRQIAVVAVHPDSESLEFHLDTGAAEFARFADLIELVRIEVYGRVSDGALERLHRKARMLGSGSVTMHDLYAGFAR